MDGRQEGPTAGAGAAEAGRAGEPMLDIVDLLGRRLMIGLALAGGLPALALYARPEPRHFEAFVAGDELIRIDRRTGSIVACNPTRCMQVLKRGQRLKSHPKGELFQGRAPAAVPAAPPKVTAAK